MDHLNQTVDLGPEWGLLFQLWQWFWELSSARAQGFSGPNPLSFAEIASWSALTANPIRQDEIAIIRKMDAAYLAANTIEQSEAAERAKHKKD